MPYSTRTDIENIFGIENIKIWADLDNTRNAATITARINWAIADADDEIDARLRNGLYVIPFTGTLDQAVITLSARLAGVKLYESRAILNDKSSNHDLTHHRNQVNMMITRLNAGTIQLTHDKNKREPAAGWDES